MQSYPYGAYGHPAQAIYHHQQQHLMYPGVNPVAMGPPIARPRNRVNWLGLPQDLLATILEAIMAASRVEDIMKLEQVSLFLRNVAGPGRRPCGGCHFIIH